MKIGFFDTGLGGATIFKEAYHQINGDYIYLADTQNSPYGTKDFDTVRNLTEKNILKLIELDCKVIVLACNTATSAAISYLRRQYPDIIFIGAEPAIKPALTNSNGKKILLTATTLTLKGSKLFTLLSELNGVEQAVLLPLDELVEYADDYSEIQYDMAKLYLKKKFSNYNFDEFSGIVLGCTHFPIFKNVIHSLLPENVIIYDSADGITKNLQNKLKIYFPEYTPSSKNIKLLLTKESENFRAKFYNMIT
jgi:glutamate racemase